MKLLFVDDHKETVRDLSSLLRRRIKGEVKVALKGDDAIRIAEEFKPDVILLDIDLPVLNGFEVLEELKRRQIDTRVIMLSGAYTDAEHIVRCIKAGACDFLKKPASTDVIVESIERHFVLDNADNLRLYAEAPSSIKQLVDRTDYEERRVRNAEVDKLWDRVHSAERELGELRIAKFESDTFRRLHDLTVVSTKAELLGKTEPIHGKWSIWWHKISPNERAAYIGLIGICMAGLFTFIIAVYNKTVFDNKFKPAAVVSSSATSPSIISPSVTPMSSVQHKNLGLTLEQYHDKLDAFNGRLGPQDDFIRSVSGSWVSWQGVVDSAGTVQAKFGSVVIRSEGNPNHYGTTVSFFEHPDQALLDRIHTLQTGDLVKVSGYLSTQRGTGIDAEKLEIMRLVGKQSP